MDQYWGLKGWAKKRDSEGQSKFIIIRSKYFSVSDWLKANA